MWNLHSLYVFTNRNFQFRSFSSDFLNPGADFSRLETWVLCCKHFHKSPVLSTFVRDINIYQVNIKLVLLYGSEIWRVTKANSTKLQTFVNTSHLSLLFILVLILRQFLLLQSKFLFYLITAAYKRKQLKNQTLLEIGVNNGKNIFSMGQIDQACSLLHSGCFECGKSLHNLSKFWLLKFISL